LLSTWLVMEGTPPFRRQWFHDILVLVDGVVRALRAHTLCQFHYVFASIVDVACAASVSLPPRPSHANYNVSAKARNRGGTRFFAVVLVR
jgi:hypothetical protein